MCCRTNLLLASFPDSCHVLTCGDGERCEGVALDATLVHPQGLAAGWTGMSDLFQTV